MGEIANEADEKNLKSHKVSTEFKKKDLETMNLHLFLMNILSSR